MPRIPEASVSTGLRRLAIGGVSVTSAYQQIAQNLDKALGPGAGLFLAEPAERGDKIDWYTAAEGPARRLADLDEPERKQAGDRLRQTLDSMAAFARLLKDEKDDYRSHLGHLIELAIQIPDERHVWMIGDQPVLTFWGTTREVGQPVESPVYKLVPPKVGDGEAGNAPTADGKELAAGASAVDGPPAAAAETGAATAQNAAAASQNGGEAAAVRVVEVQPANRAALLLLWLLLALILFAVGFQLLRSCALSIPWLSGEPLVTFCSRPGGEQQLIDLFNERERLQSERRLLLDQVEQERRMCEQAKQPPPSNGQTQPPPSNGQTQPPPSNGQTQPPPSNGQTEPPPSDPPASAQFAGCWGTLNAPISLTLPSGGTALADDFICVDTGKRGRFLMKVQDQWHCSADLTVEQAADQILLKYETVACSNSTTMSKADWTCKPAGEGKLACSEVEYPNGQPESEADQIHGIEFHHIEALPQ